MAFKAQDGIACILAVVINTSFLTSSGLANDGQEPALVGAPVEKVFVPLGFDDNDNVEVVVHGHFQSTCFKVGPSTATVDAAAKTVTINANTEPTSIVLMIKGIVEGKEEPVKEEAKTN